MQDKHREKKDKKEKDREKRESKERKEKDRNDGKHGDRKEKKDKHRDKKEKEKDKEKKSDRDQNCLSNDKKLPLQTGTINKEKTPTQKGPLPSLLPGGQAGDRSIGKEKKRDKYRYSIPDAKRPAGQNVEKITATNDNSLRDVGDNNKYVQELEKRVRNGSSGTQLAEKFMVAEKKKDDGMIQLSSKPYAGAKPEGREWNKERRDNEQKVERVNGTLKVQNFGGAVQSRAQEVTTPLEQKIDREMEWKEKSKGREDEDRWGDKWKEKDGGKKGQGKVELVKEREGERTMEKSGINKHGDQERLKLSRKNGLLSSPSKKSLHQPDKMVAALKNDIKKRKVPEANGFLHGEFYLSCHSCMYK